MNDTSGKPSFAWSASSVSDSTLWPVSASMPWPRAMNTSSWRHTTPLGMPVVPPV